MGYHILAIWAWACHISHPGLLLCFYKMGATRGRTFVAGILKLHSTDIWGQICLHCGDALCIVGCLVALLTYAHQLPVAPANPYHFVTTKYVSSQTSLNVPREQNQSWLRTLPYRAVLKREFLHLQGLAQCWRHTKHSLWLGIICTMLCQSFGWDASLNQVTPLPL